MRRLFIHSIIWLMCTLVELVVGGFCTTLKKGAKDERDFVYWLRADDVALFGLVVLSRVLPSFPNILNSIRRVLNSVADRETSLLWISLLINRKKRGRFVLMKATAI